MVVASAMRLTPWLPCQDALGASMLEVAQTVPDGLLCFLPSYNLIDSLAARWKVKYPTHDQCTVAPMMSNACVIATVHGNISQR